MNRRFTRRPNAGRFGRRRLLLWTSLVTMVVAVLVIVVGFAPVFVVKDVELTGGPASALERAQSNAHVPLGTSLARVDTDEVAERIVADHRIDSVEVDRAWPSTVTIKLTMRAPVAVLKQPKKSLRLVDASGVAYQDVDTRPRELPQISAPQGKVEASSLAGALEAVDSLGEPLNDDVSRINVTADGDVMFTMGNVDISWGRPDQAQLKAAATRALLAQKSIDPHGTQSLTIDVTAPRTPVVTGLPVAPTG